MGKKSKLKSKNAKSETAREDTRRVKSSPLSYSVAEDRPVRAKDICIIHGLKGAPQYNGSRGLILGNSIVDNGGNRRFPVRLFGHGGKELSAKVDNLKLSCDEDDWIVPAVQKSIYEMIMTDASIGGIDNCVEFATALWGSMAEKPPGRPLQIDHGIMSRQHIKSMDGHFLWWIAMDAIGHHLIIENCNGHYRVHQAYIKNIHPYGYTAKEWCCSDFRRKSAWKKFGGGKLLTSSDLDDLLDIVVRYQKLLSRVLKNVLLPAVPGLDPLALPYLEKDGLDGSEKGVDEQFLAKELKRISVWSDHLIKRVGPEGLTDVGMTEERRVQEGIPFIPVMIGTVKNGQRLFDVPASVYTQCDNINRELTGEPFNSATFLYMLNSGVWWQSRRDPDDGGAIGFSILGMDLKQDMTEEEGIRRSEQITKKMMSEFERMAVA